MAFTTLSAVQQNLRMGSADAAVLSALIPRAQRIAERYCGVDSFEAADRVEYHDGQGAGVLLLRNVPVNAVASASLLHGTASSTIDTSAYTFDPDSGEFGLRAPIDPWAGGCRAVFPPGFRNVRVSYNGGYSAVPADMVQAGAELVVFLYRNGRTNQAMQSEQIGQYGYTRAGDGPGSLGKFMEARFGAWVRPGV